MQKSVLIIHSVSEDKISNPVLHMCTVYCNSSIAYTSRIHGRDRRSIFLHVVKFANSTRLAKFAKIKPPRNIWRIQYPL